MAESANPFVRYRTRLDSYRVALDAGWSDERFVALVEELDAAVATVDGHGFVTTPVTDEANLARAIGLDSRLLVKNDTENVSGSHKSRHLFGVALHQAIAGGPSGELAIASCGNAAMAAAVTARAMDQPLRVFIPTWAEQPVVDKLDALGAHISVEERREGEVGDPTYLRFLEAVEGGATPFSVQGTVTPTTIDGGRTMGWELADQLAEHDVTGTLRVFIQIGGGALAAATWKGLVQGLGENGAAITPVLHAVQTEACAPLPRAWELLTRPVSAASWPERADRIVSSPGAESDLIENLVARPDDYMWAWEEVGMSAASGILDDVTYDWQPVVKAMLKSGGWPVVVTEEQVVKVHEAAHATTTIDVEPTGTAGLSGVLDDDTRRAMDPTDTVVALFTGVTR